MDFDNVNKSTFICLYAGSYVLIRDTRSCPCNYWRIQVSGCTCMAAVNEDAAFHELRGCYCNLNML